MTENKLNGVFEQKSIWKHLLAPSITTSTAGMLIVKICTAVISLSEGGCIEWKFSSLFLFFFYFCRKTELRVVYLLFYWCNSNSKTNHFILLARFKRFLQFQNWKKIWGRVVWWFVTCLSRAPGMVWDSPRSTQCLKRFTMISPILT